MVKERAPSRGARSLQVVVFLAGFTFLILEVSWNRLLALVLGATVTASTVVLAAFMAGFGAGAVFWGRLANATRRPGRLLGLLFAGIGALSALDTLLLTQVMPKLVSALGSGWMADAALLLVSALLVGCPTCLMGGVLPVASRIAITTDAAVAPTLGRLYALETLGSGLGGLAAGFVLLGNLGQRGTTAVAIATSLLLGAWLLTTRTFDAADPAAAPLSGAEAGRRRASADRAAARRSALVGTLACGFAMIGLQVAWLRIFKVYLTNSSYTFALVSSLAIVGLFVGSELLRRRGTRIADPQRSLMRVVLLMGVAAGVGVVFLVHLPRILLFPLQDVAGDPLVRMLLMPFLATLVIVVPPAICSGYAFPLACRLYSAGAAQISRDVGIVLVVNTVGATVGPLVVAFVLIPVLGAAWSVVVLSASLAAAALYLGRRLQPPRAAGLDRGVALAALAVAVLVAVMRPDMRILPPSFSRFDREVLFYRESVEGTLVVGRDRGTRAQAKYSFVNNSAVIGSSYDAIKTVKMIGHFPFFLGLQAENVLVIGFGIGVTTSAIATHPEVRSIECVELVAGLRDAAPYYGDLNRNVVADPRLKFIAGDGRHYLQRTQSTYDLISCDPTHPIFGSGSLYTREYFELCRAHLNPGGMVSQYLPLHKLRTEDLLGLLATFQAVFPDCALWLGHYHGVLVGALAPLAVDFTDWAARVDASGPDKVVYLEPYHLAATLALDSAAIGRLAAGRRINSDDLCYAEFFAAGCLDEGNLARNLRFLDDRRTGVGVLYRNVSDEARLARFVQGNRLLTASLLAGLEGDQGRSLALLREACRASPEDEELPFLVKLAH